MFFKDSKLETILGHVGDNVPEPVQTQEEGSSPQQTPRDIDDRPLIDENVDITIDTTQMRVDSKYNFKATEEIVTTMEDMIVAMKGEFPAGEGIGSFLAKMLVGIANSMSRIVEMGRVAIFHSLRDFKRSELTAYVANHRFTMPRIYKGDFELVKDLELDRPQGMQGTYKQAAGYLTEFLKVINMQQRTQEILTLIKAIHSDAKSTGTFKEHIANGNRRFDIKEIEQAFNNSAKSFTTKTDAGKKPFTELFSSLVEVGEVVNEVLTYDPELQSVTGIQAKMKEMEKYLLDICNLVDNVDRAQVEDLARLVRAFAITFDRYAVVINDVNRINHNLVYCLEDLRKPLKV